MIRVENADHRRSETQIVKGGGLLKKKMLDKFCVSKYTEQVACGDES